MAQQVAIDAVNRAQAGLRLWLVDNAVPELKESHPEVSAPGPVAPPAVLIRTAVLVVNNAIRMQNELRDRIVAIAYAILWLEEFGGRLDPSRGTLAASAEAEADRAGWLAATSDAHAASERTIAALQEAIECLEKASESAVVALDPLIGSSAALYGDRLAQPYSRRDEEIVDRMLANLRPALLAAQRMRWFTSGVRHLQRVSRVAERDALGWVFAPHDLLLRAGAMIDLAAALLGPVVPGYPFASELTLDHSGWEQVLGDAGLLLHEVGFGQKEIYALVDDGSALSTKPSAQSRRFAAARARRDARRSCEIGPSI